MSRTTRMTSTTVATIWRSGVKDQFGRSTFDPPLSFKCCLQFNNGKQYTSGKGIQFIPAIAAWCETIALPFVPKEGDFIVKGDYSATTLGPVDVDGSLPIMDVTIDDCSLLREVDDIRILC